MLGARRLLTTPITQRRAFRHPPRCEGFTATSVSGGWALQSHHPAHSLYNLLGCTPPVKLLLKLQLWKRATDFSQLLCSRYTPAKSQNVLKPTREHRPEVAHAVLPRHQRCPALAADKLLDPPLGTQIHLKSQLCTQCAHRCARERPKTQKSGPLAARGC